jgi:hypothetical protein
VTLEEEAAQIDAAESRTARENRRLRADLEDATEELEELRRVVAFYGAAESRPVQVPEWQVRPSKGGHRGLVVAHTTDWHLDEVVKPEEIFYLNAYNREIALLRIRKWAEKVVTLPRDYMRGIEIDGLVIPATGDLFTGTIHDELRETNDAPLLDSVVFWQEHVLAALDLLEREYPAVAVHAVVGNHGRLSHKPIFKGRVYDNVEWAFWSVIAARLRDRGSTVTVNVSPSMDLNVPIYGRNHLLTHGDQFKGGTGISGAFSPLSLGSHRKNRRQMRAGMPMDTMVIGHMHQLINIPGVIMGGCLKGYDEYAFGLNLDPDPDGAAQAMWITTPERAKSAWMPVYVQDREAEGW